MSVTADSIISLEEASFSYAQGKSILRDCSFQLKRGGLYLLEGPSGAGKSSILRLLVRLEIPSSGSIFLEGRPLASFHPPALRSNICLLQQTPVLIEGSVRDNVLLAFAFKANRNKSLPADEAIRQALDDLGLSEVSLDHEAGQLSVGQKQRLCLVRALLMQPAMLLLDEPMSALDDENAAAVEQVLAASQKKGTTIVMVSHRQHDGGALPYERIALEDGKLVNA